MSANDRLKPLYMMVAIALEAKANCEHHALDNGWLQRWQYVAETFAAYNMPSGSGFDTTPTVTGRTDGGFQVAGSYHKMDQNGSYCGWLDYRIIVRPDFINGFSLKIIGGDSSFKDYAAECFSHCLRCIFDMDAVIAKAEIAG